MATDDTNDGPAAGGSDGAGGSAAGAAASDGMSLEAILTLLTGVSDSGVGAVLTTLENDSAGWLTNTAGGDGRDDWSQNMAYGYYDYEKNKRYYELINNPDPVQRFADAITALSTNVEKVRSDAMPGLSARSADRAATLFEQFIRVSGGNASQIAALATSLGADDAAIRGTTAATLLSHLTAHQESLEALHRQLTDDGPSESGGGVVAGLRMVADAVRTFMQSVGATWETHGPLIADRPGQAKAAVINDIIAHIREGDQAYRDLKAGNNGMTAEALKTTLASYSWANRGGNAPPGFVGVSGDLADRGTYGRINRSISESVRDAMAPAAAEIFAAQQTLENSLRATHRMLKGMQDPTAMPGDTSSSYGGGDGAIGDGAFGDGPDWDAILGQGLGGDAFGGGLDGADIFGDGPGGGLGAGPVGGDVLGDLPGGDGAFGAGGLGGGDLGGAGAFGGAGDLGGAGAFGAGDVGGSGTSGGAGAFGGAGDVGGAGAFGGASDLGGAGAFGAGGGAGAFGAGAGAGGGAGAFGDGGLGEVGDLGGLGGTGSFGDADAAGAQGAGGIGGMGMVGGAGGAFGGPRGSTGGSGGASRPPTGSAQDDGGAPAMGDVEMPDLPDPNDAFSSLTTPTEGGGAGMLGEGQSAWSPPSGSGGEALGGLGGIGGGAANDDGGLSAVGGDWASGGSSASGDWASGGSGAGGDWASGGSGAGDWASGGSGAGGDWASGGSGAGDWASGGSGAGGDWASGGSGASGDWAGSGMGGSLGTDDFAASGGAGLGGGGGGSSFSPSAGGGEYIPTEGGMAGLPSSELGGAGAGSGLGGDVGGGGAAFGAAGDAAGGGSGASGSRGSGLDEGGAFAAGGGASGGANGGGMGGGGMPMMPMNQQGKDRDRERNTWLAEDEAVWGTTQGDGNGVIGLGDEREPAQRAHVPAGVAAGRIPAAKRRQEGDATRQDTATQQEGAS